ncbi:MAG: gliding motility-associated C-terminal domain-containing protein [Bacteroidota bacterium]
MKKITLTLIILFCYASAALATHQRAAEVTYKHLYGLTYKFTITMYTKTSSPADNDRNFMPISWGDGTGDEIPRIYFQPIANVFDITLNIYEGEHTFPGPASYTVSVEDPNRNFGVLNIPNSVNVPIFVDTKLIINPFLGYNSSVVLLNPPIDQGCVGKVFIHNAAAYDPDGDSLSYKLVTCKGAGGYEIPGYTFPMTSSVFMIDSINGDLIWENPVLQGEYNVAFIIEEWRFGIKISSVRRDMQINIVACDHDPPEIITIDDTCVIAGDFLQFDVTAIDYDGTNVELTGFGGPFEQSQNPAYIYPDPASGNDTVTTTFNWPTLCTHVRLEPYTALFKARDNGFPVNLVDFKTVFIKVIAPAPENLNAEPLGIGINLSWEKSSCSNAIGYKVYRRSGPSGWEPDYCETGVPAYTGFSLLTEINDINTLTLRDDNDGDGLVHGIDYCYRVTAVFFDDAESYASNEACAYLKRDVPIITHVSNDSLDLESGNPFIIWSKPIELDTIQYPGPYKYVLYRNDGLIWTNPELVVELYSLNDTIYHDLAVNLNANTKPYSYRVDLESITVGFIGSSQKASSVFVNTEPSDHEVKLLWLPKVPWENEYTIIYRKDPGATNFDSIGTTTANFYRDKGLTNYDEYCYYVSTIGHYSLPGLIDPLINFSQLTCAIPIDNVPPCKPILKVYINCEQITNELAMYLPYDSCSYDAVKYYIYYTPAGSDVTELIDSVDYVANDTTYFLHEDITTVVGCYYVTAIDSVGNISEISDIVCIGYDSCPPYDLPNVFTPNGDDENDLFVPMGYKKGEPDNPKANVGRVEMNIFNRWGKTMFTTNDPEIRWDGKNQNNNQDCENGVYYYVCDVYIITLEGEVKITLQGPITIIR